jgi:hypothetical protein
MELFMETLEPEALARRMHEAYERLAPEFGYQTRSDTKEFVLGSSNAQLMIAVCKELLEYAALREEAEQKKNAERYRFWRAANTEDNRRPQAKLGHWLYQVIDATSEDAVDDAIDTAIRQARDKGEGE